MLLFNSCSGYLGCGLIGVGLIWLCLFVMLRSFTFDVCSLCLCWLFCFGCVYLLCFIVLMWF